MTYALTGSIEILERARKALVEEGILYEDNAFNDMLEAMCRKMSPNESVLVILKPIAGVRIMKYRTSYMHGMALVKGKNYNTIPLTASNFDEVIKKVVTQS